MLIYENGRFQDEEYAVAEAARFRALADEIDSVRLNGPPTSGYLATLQDWRFDSMFGSGVAGRIADCRPALFPGLVILDRDAGAVRTNDGWVRLTPHSKSPTPDTDIEAMLADDSFDPDGLPL